jgi:hypothetical protein
MAPSNDGKSIPVTLVHKKKLIRDGKNKLLLHGYGHYGLPVQTEFNVVYLAALEDDWILAYAHVRGGNLLFIIIFIGELFLMKNKSKLFFILTIIINFFFIQNKNFSFNLFFY